MKNQGCGFRVLHFDFKLRLLTGCMFVCVAIKIILYSLIHCVKDHGTDGVVHHIIWKIPTPSEALMGNWDTVQKSTLTANKLQ